MRHTRSHTKNRRSHHKLEKPTLSKNEKGVSHIRHRASAVTGTYRGKGVVDIEAAIVRKAERQKKKAEMLGKKEGAQS